MKEKIHTGCSCSRCRKWRTKKFRTRYHRKNRSRIKQELIKFWEVINTQYWIGYTD